MVFFAVPGAIPHRNSSVCTRSAMPIPFATGRFPRPLES